MIDQVLPPAQAPVVSAAIFMPIILTYTSWVFTVLRGKVDADDIRKGKGHAY